MKKLLFLLIPFMCMAQIKFTETQYGNGKEFGFVLSSVDSGSYSQEFSIVDFDSDLWTNPLAFALKIDTLGLDTDTEIIGVYIQAYQIDKWINVDTLSAVDTLNASHALASADFYAKGLLNLNAYSFGTFPKYRLNILASHGKTDLFSCYVKLYAVKRD